MYGIYALVSLERIIISSLSALNLVSESEITFDCRAAFEKLFYTPYGRGAIYDDIQHSSSSSITTRATIIIIARSSFAHFESGNNSSSSTLCRFSGYSLLFLSLSPSPHPPPLLPLVFPSLSSLHLSTSPLSFPRWKGPRRISEGLVESRKLCSGWHTRSQKEASQVIARPTGR